MTPHPLAAIAVALAFGISAPATAQTILDLIADEGAPHSGDDPPVEALTPPAFIDPGASPSEFCRALGHVAGWMIDTSTDTACLDGVVDTSVASLDTDALITALGWARDLGIDVRLREPFESLELIGPDDKPEAHCVGARPPAPFR